MGSSQSSPSAAPAGAPYGPSFFSDIGPSSKCGASRILPLVLEILDPRSIIDVGCGAGLWLAEAARLGVDDYLGVDGYTPAESLAIDPKRFLLHDLSAPLELSRQFGLVISLEVAEHVDESAGEVLLDSLVRLGSAVLFSAAVPHQSGEHHVNERWPSYWVERFQARGFVPIDAVRPKVWDDPEIPWWYRQNTLLFCRPDLIAQSEKLTRARRATRERQLSIVHPELLLWMAHQRDTLVAALAREPTLREVMRMVPRTARRALWRRLRRSSVASEPS